MRRLGLVLLLVGCPKKDAPVEGPVSEAPEILSLGFAWPDGAWGSMRRVVTWTEGEQTRTLIHEADLGVSKEAGQWRYQPNLRDLSVPEGGLLDAVTVREATLMRMPWINILQDGGTLVGFDDRRAAVGPLYEPEDIVTETVEYLTGSIDDDAAREAAIERLSAEGVALMPRPDQFDILQTAAIDAWNLGLPWWSGRELMVGGQETTEDGEVLWPGLEGVTALTRGRIVERVPCTGKGKPRCVVLSSMREGSVGDTEVEGTWEIIADPATLLPWRWTAEREVREDGDVVRRFREDVEITWSVR